jgi:hypothetical protein
MPICHIFLMTVSADRNVCAESAAGTESANAMERRRVGLSILTPVEFR